MREGHYSEDSDKELGFMALQTFRTGLGLDFYEVV